MGLDVADLFAPVKTIHDRIVTGWLTTAMVSVTSAMGELYNNGYGV